MRVGSAAELALGVAAIAVGGAALWWAVAASYLAFGAFVLAALRKGTMIGSCGCFGREETPPHWTHVVLERRRWPALAALTAVRSPGSPLDALGRRPGDGGRRGRPWPRWPSTSSTPPSSSCPRTLIAGRPVGLGRIVADNFWT